MWFTLAQMTGTGRIIVVLLLAGFIIIQANAAASATADSELLIGKRFPVEKLTGETARADNTIIVFIPSLTEDCEYASMLTQSFYYYFDRKLAFENLPKSPAIGIVFVVGDKLDAGRSRQNILGEMKVIYDGQGEYFAKFGLARPPSKNADSTVILLDSAETIRLIDARYRSQGERLKTLENKLKELNGIQAGASAAGRAKELKVGDPAPDFRLNATQRLADLRGKVVLVSFYPAAFSGILPKTDAPDQTTSNDPFSMSGKELISCASQIGMLDGGGRALFSTGEEAERILVSSSTDAILQSWQRVLATNKIIFVNDGDYSASVSYGSYNRAGYNNRVSVIIDRRGRIAYIDRFFSGKSAEILNRKLAELLQKH